MSKQWELPRRFYSSNEKLRGLHFIVVSENVDTSGNKTIESVDNNRRKWDIVVGEDDYVFYPVDSPLYEVVNADDIYPV